MNYIACLTPTTPIALIDWFFFCYDNVIMRVPGHPRGNVFQYATVELYFGEPDLENLARCPEWATEVVVSTKWAGTRERLLHIARRVLLYWPGHCAVTADLAGAVADNPEWADISVEILT